MDQYLYKYLLILGDNSMILGHRLSELCGHGPSLETDIALTNISLDLYGQVRSYFKYAAKVKGADSTEDTIAFLRYERQYYNCLLVEQANTDFAHVIARQYLFDAFHHPLLEQLRQSKDATIAAIAEKSIKECRYHLRFSSEWVKRLGDGTEESHNRVQTAINHLYPFTHEFFHSTAVESNLVSKGIAAELQKMEAPYHTENKALFATAGLEFPTQPARQAEGKMGRHTEAMGFILSDLQYMQRAYPNMQW